jgi:hypothetical protein
VAHAVPSQSASGYQDGNGQAWRAVQAQNGLVLISRTTNIHLSSDCKAGSPRYGSGRWESANGGFVVIFGERRIGFPRQSVDIGQGEACRG